MSIICKSTGETLGTILTNHSMTLDEACDLLEIKIARTMDDYATGDGWDYDDLTMKWD